MRTLQHKILCMFVICMSASLAFALSPMDSAEKAQMRSNVLKMFYHGYDNYMRFAFPHDELKPLSASYTDSLAELGNAAPKEGSEYESCLHSLTYCPLTGALSRYRGVAMTLIDTLDTLVVVGNYTEFAKGVRYVCSHVSFDLDIR